MYLLKYKGFPPAKITGCTVNYEDDEIEEAAAVTLLADGCSVVPEDGEDELGEFFGIKLETAFSKEEIDEILAIAFEKDVFEVEQL